MNEIAPQELANLWYLKFGHAWVRRSEINDEWADIGKTLMKNNLAEYDLIKVHTHWDVDEIIKLKESE